jgi:hypothetical protein
MHRSTLRIVPTIPMLGRSTLSNKIPAGSWRTWHRHVITAVSRCTFGSSQTTLSACAAFTVPVLPPDQSYSGPSGADKGNTCKCNTVVYNLISACDACQGEPWTPYSQWSYNCTSVATPGTFPNVVPAGTRVPKWAYIDTSIGNNWNISTAQAAGDSPEVTGTASIVPILTASQSTLTVSTTGSGSSPTSTSHSSSNAGAIAGGIVGAFIVAALIAGTVAWFVIRRRRARSAPSTTYMSGQLGVETGQQAPYPLTQRLYDPSDPTTYPSKMYLPASEEHTSSSSHFPSNDGGYVGLPEI